MLRAGVVRNSKKVVQQPKPVSKAIASATFYKQGNLLTHVHNKNVIYIAYVGKYNGKYTFKYGKSTDVFQREMSSHRKNFEIFDMLYVHKTEMKDQVETMFEKELLIRNLHTTMVINNKRQIELFQLRKKSDVSKINDVLLKVIAYMDATCSTSTQKELEMALKLEEMKLKRATILYKMKMMHLKKASQ